MSQDAPAPARLRVGDGVVDLALREIYMREARSPRRVTPKAIAVLRALARVPGAVVGRADLLAEAWPDTLPTDDVLTQAITQLRKAFGTGAVGIDAGKRYIETIAKGGYRLTVDVEVLEAASASALTTDPAFAAVVSEAPLQMPMPTIAPPPRRRRWLMGAAAACLLGIAGLGVWTAFQAAGLVDETSPDVAAGISPVSRPYRLITSGPGFALSPSLSPDASMVAYAASGGAAGRERESAIVVQTTSSAVPRTLSRPPAGARDDLPAWSPDGREIAFARWDAGGACRVLLVASTGVGDEREIARCDGADLLSFGWLPDGSGLLFGTMTGADVATRLRVLDPVSGHWRNLDYAGAPGDVDFAPQVSPDGEWIGFIRNPQMGDLWRVPIEGGEPRQVTQLGAELRGWSWSPDGHSMVFGLRVDSESRLYRADVESGAVVDLGIEDAQMPSIAARNGMMAFVHRRPQFGIFRVDTEHGDWARLFPSSGRDSQPTLAPDGRQMVFTSDRAGRFELWWARLDAPDSLRPIEGVRPDTRQPPAWSADSRRLLVSAFDEANLPVILEIEPASGRIDRVELAAARPSQAIYGPEDTVFVIEETGGQGSGTALSGYRRDGQRIGGRIEGVSQMRFDAARDRVLFTRVDASGMWTVPSELDAARVVQLDGSLPSRWRYRSWTLTESGAVSYLDATPGCWSRLARFRVDGAGWVPERAECIDAISRNATNGLAADDTSVYVSLATEDGSTIGFMSLPEPKLARNAIAKWLISIRNKSS